MKISEFSNKYNISNDTVRYYMELNLIVPIKKGGHYFFDKDCEKDIQEILRLKEMNFTLQEIKEIFNFKRIGKLSPYQKNTYYQNLYKNKVEQIDKEINRLQEAHISLQNELKKLSDKKVKENNKIGIDLNVLSFFNCPKCKNDLKLSADEVINNQIINGQLSCECGYLSEIDDGILIANNVNIDQNDIDDQHIQKYIQTTDSKHIDESYNSIEWLKKELLEEDLKEKIVLEPGSGFGYFLRQVYNDLPESSYYICVDNNHGLNRYLKKLLELSSKKSNLIFITSNLPNLPLKDNLVDIVLDFSGTSNYCFDNKSFLPIELEQYYKDEILYLATFILYKRFGSNNIVDPQFRENFKLDIIKNKFKDHQFKIIKESKSKIFKINKTFGKYEDYAQVGDHIFSYQIKAKR